MLALDAEPTTTDGQGIATDTAMAALAVLLWRVQRALWTPAKRDLEERLRAAQRGNLEAVVSAWALYWQAKAQQASPQVRLMIAQGTDRANQAIAKQVNRQLVAAGYQPDAVPSQRLTQGLVTHAQTAELNRFGAALERAASRARQANLVGATPESVIEQIPDIQPTKRGSALVAREQIGAAVAAIQREAFIAAGVQYAIWTTQGDDRVRPSHRARGGRKYDVSKGLEGIWPGQEVNCRCYAQPLPRQR